MFSRNKTYIEVLAIILVCTGVGIFIGAFFGVMYYLSRKDGYYDGEERNGKAHGRGILYFGNQNTPLSRVECNNWREGKTNGKTIFVYRKQNKNDIEKTEEFETLNGFIVKNINEKKNVANISINNGFGTVGQDTILNYEYQKKYGIFKPLRVTNFQKSINGFIDEIINNNNIKVVKISLNHHGDEEGNIAITNGGNIKNMIDIIAERLTKYNKNLPIYIVNYSCFGAKKYDGEENFDPEIVDLEKTIKDIAKKYPNIKFLYAKHNDKKTSHIIYPTYDKIKKLRGLKHFNLKYSLVENGKFRDISKGEKNSILFG